MGIVLWREMLEAARRAGSWRLRWVGPLVLLGVFGWARVALRGGGASWEGLALFGLMSKASIGLAWLVLPWTTADAIAAERREGTLGLLWLTPLTPGGVLMAKTAAHGIRAAWMLASMAPVMVWPVLMGGVGWADISRWALAWLAMAGLSLTSGMVASAVATGWWTVRLGALMGNVVALGLMVLAWDVASAVPDWLARGQPAWAEYWPTRLRAVLGGRFRAWGEVRLGNLPFAWAASWGSVARMGWVTLMMTALAGTAAWGAAMAMGRRRGLEWDRGGARRGDWSAWVEAWMPWGLAGPCGLLLLVAVVDWPRPGWVRDMFMPCAWAAQGLVAIAGATAVRGMGEAGMGEMVAVTPLGLGGWARQTMERIETRLGLGWLLALMAQGIAMVAAARGGNAWPWWLAPRLALEAATATACGWAMLWTAAAVGWGRRPWAGVLAAVTWGWVGMPTLGLMARVAVDALPWTFLGGWNEPWQSSRMAWRQPRVGSIAIAGVLQVAVMVLHGAWMRHGLVRMGAGRGRGARGLGEGMP